MATEEQKKQLPKMQMYSASMKVAVGLDNILSEDVKQEFNTYNYFGIFDSFDDYYVPAYDPKTGKEIFSGSEVNNKYYVGIRSSTDIQGRKNNTVTTGSPAVRSLFNRSGQVLIGRINGAEKKNVKHFWTRVRNNASEWRVALNVPLMDSPETRKRIREHSGCTIKELVTASKAGDLGRAKYSYADFMYCKYLGRISNNYLITLRRFPSPPGDCITTSGTGKTRSSGRRGKKSAAGASQAVEDMGCLVTWMGTPGNDMNNVLKYSVTMPFEEKEAGWEDIQVDGDSSQGFLPSIASAFNDSYRKQYCAGYGGSAFNSWLGKGFNVSDGPYSAKDFANFRDKNKIYGPVDVVKKIYKRSENGGLDFKQNITIVFDYELRSYNGINPRQAMLDLISNILNVTYTSGGWWGGGYKGGGMAQSSVFTNLNIFKNWGGTFTGFCDALQKDYQTLSANLASQVQSAGGILQYCLKLLNNIGGMIMGGLLNKMGRPARAMMNSLLSEQPVGFWHLMVGNPHHPIISVGNMILKNTTIEHYGPLGLDDFPTGLKVTCELDRGKPRDNREVEKMYMNGNDRIYSSIGPKVIDMYQKAAAYKSALLKEIETEQEKDKQHIVSDVENHIILQNEINDLQKEQKIIQDHYKNSLNELKNNYKKIDDFRSEYYDEYPFKNIDLSTESISSSDNIHDYIKSDMGHSNIPIPYIRIYKHKNDNPGIYKIAIKYGDEANAEINISDFDTSKDNNYHFNLDLLSDTNKIIQDGIETKFCIIAALNALSTVSKDNNSQIESMYNDIMNSDEFMSLITENEIFNEKMEGHKKELSELTSKIDKNQETINDIENKDLYKINERYQDLASDLNKWGDDKKWRDMSSDERITELSKLADTDWYNLLYNWFGQSDLYSISMAAQEIEYGSYKKRDTELKVFNPDKTDTAQASATMLKKVFDRHDWADESVKDVSVAHIDGAGNIHRAYIQVSKGEKDQFIKDYEEYLSSGDFSKIKKYVDTDKEKELSYSTLDGKEVNFTNATVVPYLEKKEPIQENNTTNISSNTENNTTNISSNTENNTTNISSNTENNDNQTTSTDSSNIQSDNDGGNITPIGENISTDDDPNISLGEFNVSPGEMQEWGIPKYNDGDFTSHSIPYGDNDDSMEYFRRKGVQKYKTRFQDFWYYRKWKWNDGIPTMHVYDFNKKNHEEADKEYYRRIKTLYTRIRETTGWNDLQIAGFIALGIHESKLKTGSRSHTDAYGLYQWTGSRKKLLKKRYQGKYDIFENQVEYTMEELRNPVKKSNGDLVRKHMATVGKDIRRAVEVSQGFFAFQAGYPSHQLVQVKSAYSKKYGSESAWKMVQTNAENTVATAHWLLGVKYPATPGWPGYGSKYVQDTD